MDRGDDILGNRPKLILAKNIKALKKAFPEAYSSQAKVGKSAGVSQSTIDRLEEGETNCRIETVASVAQVFGMEAWQLLVASFDPLDPPELATTPEERRLLRAMHGKS